MGVGSNLRGDYYANAGDDCFDRDGDKNDDVTMMRLLMMTMTLLWIVLDEVEVEAQPEVLQLGSHQRVLLRLRLGRVGPSWADSNACVESTRASDRQTSDSCTPSKSSRLDSRLDRCLPSSMTL